VRTYTEVQRSVDALLDVREADRAEEWLSAWAERARESQLDDWLPWEVSARQRLRLERGQFEEAATAPLPSWAEKSFDAKRTNDFMRGVALLRVDPPRPIEAIKIYEKLLKEVPGNVAYRNTLTPLQVLAG
jgi:hypothetical protein